MKILMILLFVMFAKAHAMEQVIDKQVLNEELFALLKHDVVPVDQIKALIEQGVDMDAKDESERTFLHWAAWKGHERVASLLISRGSSIEARDSCSYTPLHQAAGGNQLKIVVLLLSHGADIRSIDRSGRTPLYYAVMKGHRGLINVLIKHGAQVRIADEVGKTPLHFAAERGREDIVELLLEHGADSETTDRSGRSAFHYALIGGFGKVVNLFVEKLIALEIYEITMRRDANVLLHCAVKGGCEEQIPILIRYGGDVRMLCGNSGTLLHLAVMGDSREMVKLLIGLGLEVNARDEDENTPLLYLLSNVRMVADNDIGSMVDTLITYGTDVRAVNKFGSTALHCFLNGNPCAPNVVKDIAEMLIRSGVDINAQNRSLSSPLEYAAYMGHLEVAKLLLDRGANINVRNDSGCTPLHLTAQESGKFDAVKLLLERGADVTVEEKNGCTPLRCAMRFGVDCSFVSLLLDKGAGLYEQWTPLHSACALGDLQEVESLIEAHVDINSIDKNGLVPLSIAMLKDQKKVVDFLIAKGADVSKADSSGDTPFHLAALYGTRELVENLLACGARLNQCNKKNLAPLHYAVLRGSQEIIEVLLWYGADISVYSQTAPLEFISPLYFALENRSSEICHLLLSHCLCIPDKNCITNAGTLGTQLSKQIIMSMCCLKRLGFSKDLSLFILSKNSSIVEDMFCSILPRIKRGMARNCLAEYMKAAPLFLRQFVMERIYTHTIDQIKRIVKPIELDKIDSGIAAIIDLEALESNFGKSIRENICNHLGFKAEK